MSASGTHNPPEFKHAADMEWEMGRFGNVTKFLFHPRPERPTEPNAGFLKYAPGADFVNRFAKSDDEATIASLNPILGGPGWGNRLDPNLRRGPAVEKLFRDSLKAEGNFDFVISTRIEMVTAERPHFFIAYGTKSLVGLKTFRQTEYDALREHEKSRAYVKEKQREERSNMVDLFSGHQAAVQEATIDDIVDEQKALASADLMATLALNGPLRFSGVVARLLQTYMLRETNVKDICVDLAKAGAIENTWGSGNRKPHDGSIIKLNNSEA